eukprot:1102047-Prymnesium_polylepis.2
MGWRAPCTISAIVPLTRALLDRCVGSHLNGAAFSHVARAVWPWCRAKACASGTQVAAMAAGRLIR